MKTYSNANRISSRSIRFGISLNVALSLITAIFFSATIQGQGILAPASGPQTTRPNASYFGKPASKTSVSQPITGGVNPYAWGPVAVRPGLSFRYIYGDGLLGSRGEQRDSSLQEISPNFDFEIGEQFDASYSPTWRIYSDEAFKDVVDHTASFGGQGSPSSWTLGFNQDYSFTTPSLIEAGRQAEQESWNTVLNAYHAFNRTFYYNGSANQDIRNVEDFTDSTQWSFANRLHYAPSTIIDYALSGTYGYTDIDPGRNMEFQQYTGSVALTPSEKTEIVLEAGVDVRKFDFSGAEQFSNPIYNASLRYTPTEATTLIVAIEKSLDTSLFEDTVVEKEGFQINYRQRLLGKFNLNLVYSNHDSIYADDRGDTSGGRDDSNETFDVRLGAVLLHKINMSAFYRYNQNESNLRGFEFDSDQVGFEARYQY